MEEMPHNIHYTFSVFVPQLTILLPFSGFSHPNYQSLCHCLQDSLQCSQHFTCSTNSPLSLAGGTWPNRVPLYCFCLPLLKLLNLPLKNRCFLTAFSLTPLLVPMTSLCSLSSSCSSYIPVLLLSLQRSSGSGFFLTNASLSFTSETALSASLEMRVIYLLSLESRFNL